MDITDAGGIAEKPFSDFAQPDSGAVVRPRQEISLEFFDQLEPVCHDWQALEADAACTPFQTYAWTHAWRTHVESASQVSCAIVVGRDDTGTVQMILPLALRKTRPGHRSGMAGWRTCDLHRRPVSPRLPQPAFKNRFS